MIVRPLVVVSDYLDVWRLQAAGATNTVALLDGRLSRHQEQLLEVFNPASLLLLQTTIRDLHSVSDRLMEQFFVRHEVVQQGTDLASYVP